jgi:hypothetical protein
MPQASGPKQTAKENLIFAYDVGDVKNSYAGEPTTNQYTNPDFTNGTTGWSFASWDGNVTYGTDNVLGPFRKTIPVLKLTKNTTSAYSHFHQYNSGKYTTGNQYTLSAWVKGSGTLRGNTQWGGIEQSFSLTGDWQYVKYTVTAPNNDNFPYWAAEALTTGTVMYMVYAQSEQKTHATPYTAGTRSATQGLLPLIGNSTIDLTNVSFDANAQMVFDGTNDYMVTSTAIPCNFGTGDFTVEVLIYPESFASYAHMVALPNQSTFALKANISDGVIYYYDPAFSTYGSTSGWTLTLNQWNHVILTRSGNVAYAYLNGVPKGSKTGFNTNFSSTQIVNVGNGGVTEYTQKKIDVVKIYNRALTAQEVRQNYQQYKTRFKLS